MVGHRISTSTGTEHQRFITPIEKGRRWGWEPGVRARRGAHANCGCPPAVTWPPGKRAASPN